MSEFKWRERTEADNKRQLVESSRYSSDRQALGNEIIECLATRGFWYPYSVGPDLIMAVAKALDQIKEEKQ